MLARVLSDDVAAAGFAWMVSRRTHGGKLMLRDKVDFGPLFTATGRDSTASLLPTRRALVGSNGVANWFPLRTGGPAEIVHVIPAVVSGSRRLTKLGHFLKIHGRTYMHKISVVYYLVA